MKRAVAVLFAGWCCLVGLSGAPAQSRVDASFDTSRTVTLKGQICSAYLAGPRSYVYVVVKLDGRAETWKLEFPPPNRMPQGVSQDDFKTGNSVTVDVYPSKTASTPGPTQTLFYSACPASLANVLQSGYATEITVPSGRRVRLGL